MSEPFYHLRPNKYVDRQLFAATLSALAGVYDLPKYHYIGFGSYLFDDFKLLHNLLNIQKMTSLEADHNTYERAVFNLPYNCINVIESTSTDYITYFEHEDKNYIFWLDYTNPSEIGQQFSDIASLLDKAVCGDIIKVTINANVSSLSAKELYGEAQQKKRLEELNNRLGDSVPCDITYSDMTTTKYPLTLLKCLKSLIEKTLSPSEYDSRFFVPLLTTIYRDGQFMLTLTGIVLENEEERNKVKSVLERLNFVSLAWDKVTNINIPNLTIKEILEINKLLPSDDALKQINENFSFVFDEKENQHINYISFYKYYPNFHHFSL